MPENKLVTHAIARNLLTHVEHGSQKLTESQIDLLEEKGLVEHSNRHQLSEAGRHIYENIIIAGIGHFLQNTNPGHAH